MDFIELETERLYLKEIEKQYEHAYYDIMSRKDVTAYYGMDPLESIDQAKQMIQSFKKTFMNHRGIRWGLILKENEKFIGTVGLNNLVLHSKRAEIGYEIHPDFWRKGYTSEAILAVLDYSFNDLKLNRVGAVTFPANEPSNNLLIKLGFKLEGISRQYLYQNNKSHDAYVFSKIRDLNQEEE